MRRVMRLFKATEQLTSRSTVAVVSSALGATKPNLIASSVFGLIHGHIRSLQRPVLARFVVIEQSDTNACHFLFSRSTKPQSAFSGSSAEQMLVGNLSHALLHVKQ
jgi:hypothetical protein